jgi:hypothetical protein
LLAARPYLLQQVNSQLICNSLPQQDSELCLVISDMPIDLFVAGRDHSAADQPNNNLAEGQPSL